MEFPMKKNLIEAIEQRTAVIGVIGLGYVGLPLLLEFGKAGFPIIGLDIDATKVARLKEGRSYIKHIDSGVIGQIFSKSNANATTDFSLTTTCDAVLICVPTPLTHHRDPDMSYIIKTAEQIAPYIRRDQLISLESTTYPGTTEEVLIPILEHKSGLKAGKDFFVSFSPEREDPNNKNYSTATIPKVVGGLTPECLEIARALYDTIICTTVPVSNCRTAEATKLMENIFRSINIALVNELKVVFTRMDIDIWEVIRAASTKPFGYMPFYPGPGLGGHCIPIDPFYLTWKAREYDVDTRFIELAGQINTSMPHYVVQQTILSLNERKKALNGSRVLLIGLAYKKNVDDDRESPTYQLWKILASYGASVDYFDPFIPVVLPSREHSDLAGIPSKTWSDISSPRYDVAIISTAHDNVDHDALTTMVDLVIDTRGVCKDAENLVRA